MILELKKILHFFKKQGFFVFLGRLYFVITTFLISFFLTKYLSEDDYGKYKFFFSIFSLLSVFSLVNSADILMKYIDRIKNKFLLFNLIRYRLKFSLFGFILLTVITLNNFSSEFSIYTLFFTCLCFFPFYSFDSYIPYYNSQLNFRKLNINYILRDSIKIISLLIGVFFGASFTELLLIFIGSVSVSNFLFVSEIYYKQKKKKSVLKKTSKLIRSQTLILSIIGVLGIFRYNVDKILIGNYENYESLAVYSIGVLVGTNINSFFKIFLNTVNAKLVYIKLNITYYLVLLLSGTFIGVFLSFLIIPYFFELIYGVNYINGLIYCQIIVSSLGLLFIKTIYYNSSLLHKNNNIKVVHRNNILTPLIIIIYMILIFFTSEIESNEKFIYLSLMFPLEYILNIIIIYLNKIQLGNTK